MRDHSLLVQAFQDLFAQLQRLAKVLLIIDEHPVHEIFVVLGGNAEERAPELLNAIGKSGLDWREQVQRHAGLQVAGINFPGHFLLRCPSRRGLPYSEDLIIDAFHGGALLSEDACKALLQRHAGDEAVFDPRLLITRATKPQILIEARSFLIVEIDVEELARFNRLGHHVIKI